MNNEADEKLAELPESGGVTSGTNPSWRLVTGDQYNCQCCLVSSLIAWMLGHSALSARRYKTRTSG